MPLVCLLSALVLGCGEDKPLLASVAMTISQQPAVYDAEIVDEELILVVGTSPVISIKVFDETGAERTDTTSEWSSLGPATISRLATEPSEGLHGQFVVLGVAVGGTQLSAIDDLLINVEVREQVFPRDDIE